MSSVLAFKMYLLYKILPLKKEGNTSHVNQAYNKFVAKINKESCSYSVGVESSVSNTTVVLFTNGD